MSSASHLTLVSSLAPPPKLETSSAECEECLSVHPVLQPREARLEFENELSKQLELSGQVTLTVSQDPADPPAAEHPKLLQPEPGFFAEAGNPSTHAVAALVAKPHLPTPPLGGLSAKLSVRPRPLNENSVGSLATKPEPGHPTPLPPVAIQPALATPVKSNEEVTATSIRIPQPQSIARAPSPTVELPDSHLPLTDLETATDAEAPTTKPRAKKAEVITTANSKEPDANPRPHSEAPAAPQVQRPDFTQSSSAASSRSASQRVTETLANRQTTATNAPRYAWRLQTRPSAPDSAPEAEVKNDHLSQQLDSEVSAVETSPKVDDTSAPRTVVDVRLPLDHGAEVSEGARIDGFQAEIEDSTPALRGNESLAVPSSQFAQIQETATSSREVYRAAEPAIGEAPSVEHQVQRGIQQAMAVAGVATSRTFKVKLDPPHLGQLEISVERAAEGMNVRMTFSNAEAMDWVGSGLDELRTTLAESGVDVGEFSLKQDNSSNTQGSDGHPDKDETLPAAQPIPMAHSEPEQGGARINVVA